MHFESKARHGNRSSGIKISQLRSGRCPAGHASSQARACARARHFRRHQLAISLGAILIICGDFPLRKVRYVSTAHPCSRHCITPASKLIQNNHAGMMITSITPIEAHDAGIIIIGITRLSIISENDEPAIKYSIFRPINRRHDVLL